MDDNTPVSPPVLTTDNLYKAAQKEQILADWRHFVTHGFQQQDFSYRLYQFLHRYCDLPDDGDLERFWHDFFNKDADTLVRFIRQFSGTGLNAVYSNHGWLYTEPRDLKLEMCATLSPLAPVLIQLLDGLSTQYQVMIEQWQTLTQVAKLPHQSPASSYRISHNTRQLLAFAAQSISAHRSLNGLQTMFT